MATTPNRGYIIPDEYTDDWYNEFVTLITAIDTDVDAVISSSFTEDIQLKKASPSIRLIDTSTGDFRITIESGKLVIQNNTGTEAIPIWDTLVALKTDGDVNLLKAGKGLVVRDDGDNNDYRIGVTEEGGEGVLFADKIS